MIDLHKQKGAGMMNVILLGGVIIFAGFTFAKIGTFYLDNNIVKKTLSELDEVPYITKKSKRELSEMLRKKFQTNNLRFTKDEVIVNKRSDKLIITMEYERRAPIMGNVDVVVKFSESFETANQ
jgi:hypothetical protein